jgi:hypothetical protein
VSPSCLLLSVVVLLLVVLLVLLLRAWVVARDRVEEDDEKARGRRANGEWLAHGAWFRLIIIIVVVGVQRWGENRRGSRRLEKKQMRVRCQRAVGDEVPCPAQRQADPSLSFPRGAWCSLSHDITLTPYHSLTRTDISSVQTHTAQARSIARVGRPTPRFPKKATSFSSAQQ